MDRGPLRAFLFLMLLVAAPDARAETCIAPPGAGLWTSACAPAWMGCSCSEDDDFVVGADSILVLPPDEDARTSDVDVRLTGGSLTIQSGGSVFVGPGAQLELPSGDLRVEAGGSLQTSGRALTYGGAEPGWTAALEHSNDPRRNTAVALVEVIHCPGSDDGFGLRRDCRGQALVRPGSPQEIALCWPGGANTIAGRWLSRINPGDVLVFWDPSGGLAPSRDVNAMYEIVSDAFADPAGCLIVDVRQGSGDESCAPDARGCRLAQRDVLEVELAASCAAGQGEVQIHAGALGGDGERTGRWLTCPLAGGAGALHTALITRSERGPGEADTLRLLSGGFGAAVADSTRCWIDYGWLPGDVVSVFRPAVLGDGVEVLLPDDGNDADLVCEPGSRCAFDLTLAQNHGWWELWGPDSEHSIANLWIRDGIHALAAAGVHLIDQPGLRVSRLQVSSPRYYGYHGICLDGEAADDVVFEDLVFRHLGDDALVNQCCRVSGSECVPGGDPAVASQSYTARRVRATYIGGGGGSCGVVDSNLSSITGTAIDIAIDGLVALDSECPDSETFNNHNHTVLSVHDAALVGGRFVPFNAQGTDPQGRTYVDQFFDAGRHVGPSPFAGEIWGAVRSLRDASFVDVRVDDPDGLVLGTLRQPLAVENVVLRNFSSAAQAAVLMAFDGQPEAALSLRDVAIVNPQRSDGRFGGSLLDFRHDGPVEDDPVELERITLALRPGQTTRWAELLRWSGDDLVFDTRRRAHRLLFANLRGDPDLVRPIELGPGEYGDIADLCFSGNQQDATPEVRPLLHPSTRFDVPLEEPDELRDVIRPAADSGLSGVCGARLPGVARESWSLRVLHHDPVAAGDSWKTSSCGNGVREWGELCDDGNRVGGDACPPDCAPDLDLDGVADASDVCPSVPDPGQEDRDADASGDACDPCPDYASSDLRDTDGNGIGDVCECGDQTGDGRVDVLDVAAIGVAILNPALATPLCDTNADDRCDVLDLIGAANRVFGAPAFCSRYPPSSSVP